MTEGKRLTMEDDSFEVNDFCTTDDRHVDKKGESDSRTQLVQGPLQRIVFKTSIELTIPGISRP